MQQRLTEINRILQAAVSVSQPLSVIPRGIVFPLIAHGKQRFSRRLGIEYPVMIPSNTMRLSRDHVYGDVSVHVSKLLPGLSIGSVLALGGEKHTIQDVNSVDNIVHIESSGLLANHATGDEINLHSVPVEVSSVSNDKMVVSLSSPHALVLGDVLEVLVDEGVPGSAVEYSVAGLTLVEESNGLYTYDVLVQSTLPEFAFSTMYLRAYPAFVSDLIPLPTQQHIIGKNVGPFLWDIVDNRLHDGIEPPQTFLAIESVSSSFNVQSALSLIGKNSVHWYTPIPSSAFGLFDLHLGLLDTYRSGEALLDTMGIPDENGDFLISKEMRPAAQPPETGWRATFRAVGCQVNIRIGFHLASTPSTIPETPEGYTYSSVLRVYYRNAVIDPGSVVSILLRPPSGLVFDRIDIGASFGPPAVEGSERGLVLRDWLCVAGRSSWVRYTMLARVTGDYSWGCSTLLIKPLFLTEDSLRFLERTDSGSVLL